MIRKRFFAFVLGVISIMSICNVTEIQAAATFTKADFEVQESSSDSVRNLMDPEIVDYKTLGDYKYFVVKLSPYEFEERLIPELVYFEDSKKHICDVCIG